MKREDAREMAVGGLVKMQAGEHVALQDAAAYLNSQMRIEPDRNVFAGAGRIIRHIQLQHRVGVMSIGRHPLWCVTNHIDSLLEKAPGCLHISLLTQHGVNHIAIAIDGAIEVAPFSLDVDVGFIDIPGPASLSSSLDSQLVGDEWGKTGLRVSNGLMGELKAALQEHLRQITQTQLIPQPPEHDEQDDIGGIFEKVERRSCTLVEGSLAR